MTSGLGAAVSGLTEPAVPAHPAARNMTRTSSIPKSERVGRIGRLLLARTIGHCIVMLFLLVTVEPPLVRCVCVGPFAPLRHLASTRMSGAVLTSDVIFL